MKKKCSTRLIVLIACVVVFLVSAFVLQATLTSGFKVKTQTVDIYTDDGVNLNATLFVPSNATPETPAAAVLVAPGGNTPHNFYASYCIELSRRGYVVLAYDYYGTMSSGYSDSGSSGAIAAMKYLTSLSFVDTNRLAATGHSNGGAQASAAMTSEYAESAAHKAVLFIGCGIPSEAETYDGINVGCIWGKFDEAGQGTFWDVYHTDSLNFDIFEDLVGQSSDEIETFAWYGNPDDNTGRIVFTPNTFHSLTNIMPVSVSEIIEYMDTTLDGNVSGLAPSSHIYAIEEFAVLFMAIALCVMIFPIGSILLDTKFFKSVKKPVPEATEEGKPLFWIFTFAPVIIGMLLIESQVIQGQNILGKLPQIFNVQSTNGFVWWFFLVVVISLVFFGIRVFLVKDVDRNQALARLKTTPVDLAKAVLFGLLTISLPYLLTVLGESYTGYFGRIFQTYFADIAPERTGYYIVYFIMFAVLFSAAAFMQADGLRLKNASSKVTYLLTWLVNGLPALLFLIILYGRLIITRITPITGREMSRAQGVMMGMVFLYFVITKSVTYFYKKSGNIYIPAMVNAAFVTWLSVNTPQLMM